MEFPDIVLAAYHEQANWARHYDTIRVGITALAVTLSGATATAVWTLTDNRAAQNAVCCAMVAIGFLLSGLSVLYNAEYRSSQIAERKMQGLVIDYLTGEKDSDSACQTDIWKKQAQAYYESLGIPYPKAIAKLGCKKPNGEWEQWPERYKQNSEHWNKLKFSKAFGSTWIWLNVAFGIIVPLVLFKLRPSATFKT